MMVDEYTTLSLVSLIYLPQLRNAQNEKIFLLGLFVMTLSKAMEKHIKMVTVANFEKLQQDLCWKWVEGDWFPVFLISAPVLSAYLTNILIFSYKTR